MTRSKQVLMSEFTPVKLVKFSYFDAIFSDFSESFAKLIDDINHHRPNTTSPA